MSTSKKTAEQIADSLSIVAIGNSVYVGKYEEKDTATVDKRKIVEASLISKNLEISNTFGPSLVKWVAHMNCDETSDIIIEKAQGIAHRSLRQEEKNTVINALNQLKEISSKLMKRLVSDELLRVNLSKEYKDPSSFGFDSEGRKMGIGRGE